ncbi:MAG: O-antigen ligase family protein [Rhizomicrobium sp.]
MASEAAAFRAAPPSAQSSLGFADAALLCFLLLIFVTLAPFATRDPATLSTGGLASNGAGNAIRQVTFLGSFLLLAVAGVRANGFRALNCLSPLFAALLIWCALSAWWGAAPHVVLRRAILETVIVLSAMMGVATVGNGRSLALLRGVLGAILVINWLSIPLVRNAVHLPGELDPQLVGDWRGLYFHKNIAGSVSALTAILFFFRAWKVRPFLNGAFCLAAVAFTIMTASKSSLGLLPVAIAAGCLYGAAWRRGLDRAILCTALLLAAILAGAVLVSWSGLLAHAFADPTKLTGRTAIWQGEIAFIRDHFLLGAGFGSFSDTGAASLLHNYVADTWVLSISQGHNAYLEILVTIGAVGFALAMLVLVVAPARAFWRFGPANFDERAVLLAIFVFMLAHNFLESDFLGGDDPAWVVFLMMLAMLRPSTPGWRSTRP